jgi:hypothetical protein
MYRLLACSLALLTLGTACTKYPLVALFDGNWSGTATDAAGQQLPMIASFAYDEEATPQFTGTVDQGGYVYNVIGAESDKEAGNVTAIYALGRELVMANTVLEEETTMKGDYTVNTCYGQTAPADPAVCNLTGTFTMEQQ